MKIAVLGQGAMGTRMADRLAAAGISTARWNRTGSDQTPRTAVADADIVVAMLRDDAASTAVWLDAQTGALAGMKAGALAIESSTLSIAGTARIADAVTTSGRGFIDAPVLGSRPQAEAGQLIHLIGGSAADVERGLPLLAYMGGKQYHVGPVTSGMALKLIANTLFGIQVTAVAELIGLMRHAGIDPARAIDILAQTPVMSPATQGAAGLMLADRREAMFPVDLVAKDFGYALATSAPLPVATAAAAVFGRAQTSGWGEDNLTTVSALYAAQGKGRPV